MSFLEGTSLATPGGPVRIEALRPGAHVLTARGTPVAVQWVGRQTIHRDFARERSQPVCIRAGALGQGAPSRDLTVTANHGLIIDDLIVHAAAMINNRSVHWVGTLHLPERFAVYHVETAQHETLVANGVWAESFFDHGGAGKFDNAADRRGGARQAEKLLPRIATARLLPTALRDRLGLPDEDPQFGDLRPLLTGLS